MNIQCTYSIYSDGSFENKIDKITKVKTIFTYFVYSGGSFENKINRINKIIFILT